MTKCDFCTNDLDGCWLTLKGKNYCSDCWAKMKNPPKINCVTPETLQHLNQTVMENKND